MISVLQSNGSGLVLNNHWEHPGNIQTANWSQRTCTPVQLSMWPRPSIYGLNLTQHRWVPTYIIIYNIQHVSSGWMLRTSNTNSKRGSQSKSNVKMNPVQTVCVCVCVCVCVFGLSGSCWLRDCCGRVWTALSWVNRKRKEQTDHPHPGTFNGTIQQWAQQRSGLPVIKSYKGWKTDILTKLCSHSVWSQV